MEIVTDGRAKRFIQTLSDDDQGRVLKHLDFLEKYGFNLPSKYLKKLNTNLWELRPGNIRLLFGKITSNQVIIVHGFKKKTQKTPKQDLETAMLRIREYTV